MKYKFFFVLLLAGIINAQITGPKIYVQSPDYDFGIIPQGGTVYHDYIIVNNGGDKLEISDVKPGCGCTAAKPEKNELEPGESTKLTIEFNTVGRQGPQNKYVYVFSNDKDNPEIRLTFRANIVKEKKEDKTSAIGPKIKFDEINHDFGKVTEGSIQKWTAKIKNIGTGNLEINDIQSSCGCTAADISKKLLLPGETANLEIEFNTKNYSGEKSRTVTVFTNDQAAPETVLTIHANIEKKQ